MAGHCCKVVILRGKPPTLDELRSSIAGRIGAAPELTRRLGGTADSPAWVHADGSTPEAHVVAAGARVPVDDAGLRELVADLFAQRLDRQMPLWRIDVAELSDGGRASDLAPATTRCRRDDRDPAGAYGAVRRPGRRRAADRARCGDRGRGPAPRAPRGLPRARVRPDSRVVAVRRLDRCPPSGRLRARAACGAARRSQEAGGGDGQRRSAPRRSAVACAAGSSSTTARSGTSG